MMMATHYTSPRHAALRQATPRHTIGDDDNDDDFGTMYNFRHGGGGRGGGGGVGGLFNR